MARPIAAALILALFLLACSEKGTPEPPYFSVITVEGSPYDRGKQHGEALPGEIRYFYTKFLSAGLIPWLNRERPTIAGVLKEYEKGEYDHGQFGYKVLLDNGLNLLGLEWNEEEQAYVNINKIVPNPLQEYIDELRGLADGSKVDFSKIVVLNTFLDTLFGMRAVIFAIRNLEEPTLESVVFEQEQNGEWVEVGRVDRFEPSPFASITEIPADARIRFRLLDQCISFNPANPCVWGIDKKTVRIQFNRDVFRAEDREVDLIDFELQPEILDVVFTPPRGIRKEAALQSLQIQAGDVDYTDVPPIHGNVMRDERTAFTTEGYARKYGIPPGELHRIPNLGDVDERLQPTSLSFAVRGSATTHGQVLAAHHATALDNDTAHRSGAVIVHKPDNRKPFVTVGIAGVIWGSSGMSGDGLAYMYNLSDSHDSPVTREVIRRLFCLDLVEKDGLGALCLCLDRVKLLSTGTPIGILMRKMVQENNNALDAAAYLKDAEMSFAWNILLADAQGNLVAVERDANIFGSPDGGHFAYAPVHPRYPSPSHHDLDPWGDPWASVGQDDLRMAQHFRANKEDFNLLGILPQQRFWTSYYYRSLRVFYLLGDEIADAYGNLDLAGVERILREPYLNDMRNSMNSAIYAPDELKMWFALGEVPATGAPYREVNFGALIGR